MRLAAATLTHIVIAGRHVHHFNFGIALLTAVGALAVGGLYLAGVPFWHGAAREIARTRPST